MVLVGFGVYGVLNIKLDYDAIWFMDQKSYQTHYFKRFQEAFPDQGERVEVYIGEYKICLPMLNCLKYGISMLFGTGYIFSERSVLGAILSCSQETKKFSNFFCMFLNPNNFFQFEFLLF